MKRLSSWLSVAVLVALPVVGCGENRSPVSPSVVAQSGSGFSDSTNLSSSGSQSNPGGGTTGSPARIDGVISDLSGGGGAFQFRLGDRLVRGDDASKVIDGSRTRDGSALRNGWRVSADGFDRGDHVYAGTITVTGSGSADPVPPRTPPTPPDPPRPGPAPGTDPTPDPGSHPNPGTDDTTLSGVLGAVSGVCPALAFPINGSVVVTNGSTAYVGGNCQSLALGGKADVKGTPNGGVVLAREVRIR